MSVPDRFGRQFDFDGVYDITTMEKRMIESFSWNLTLDLDTLRQCYCALFGWLLAGFSVILRSPESG